MFSILLIWAITIAKAQNSLLIGEQVYPCSYTYSFIQNSDFMRDPLDIIFANDNETIMVVVSLKTMTPVRVSGNLFIYLDDNSIITCTDKGKFDYVDNIATTVYPLTSEQLNRLKNTNINKIRYSLKCFDCSESSEEGTFTASNMPPNDNWSMYSKLNPNNRSKTDFTEVISNLLK